MDADRFQRIWSEIIENEKKTSVSRLEGEMTIYDYMEQTGVSRDKARKRLSKLVAQGKLTVRKKIHVPELGGVFNLYRPVVDDE